MALIPYKPTSAGRRSMVRPATPDLHKGEAYRPLLEKQNRTVEEKAAVEVLRETANAMISAAETAYVTAAGHVAHGERQIEMARRNEQAMINARG